MRDRRLFDSLEAAEAEPSEGAGVEELENMEERRRLDRFFPESDMVGDARLAPGKCGWRRAKNDGKAGL